MWSDPDDVENWAVSPRGAGWLFGGAVTREVCPPPLSLLLFPHHTDSRARGLLIAVQPRQLADAYRTRASTCAGWVQVHVR